MLILSAVINILFFCNTDNTVTSESQSNGEPQEEAVAAPLTAEQIEEAARATEAKRQKETELGKYWKTVEDNPMDFTGWTYLLQYVEQEVLGHDF